MGWRVYARLVLMMDCLVTLLFLIFIFSGDATLPVRSSPVGAPADTVLLMTFFLIANLIGVARLVTKDHAHD